MSDRRSMKGEASLVERLAKVKRENRCCADCTARSPRWASFLLDNHDAEDTRRINVKDVFCVVVGAASFSKQSQLPF